MGIRNIHLLKNWGSEYEAQFEEPNPPETPVAEDTITPLIESTI